ncbi:MAG: hypothetical protein FWF56_02160 [Firmicutes bacterium]|nr:hypothetical protein [Bacillota bacterium]MCL1954107.1 hypothetical protein [Bacillota bacterium]
MRKKLSGIALLVASLLLLVACANTNNGEVSNTLDTISPWQGAWNISNNKIEQTTYSITKELRYVKTDIIKKIGEGTATYTIQNISPESEKPANKKSQLNFDFELVNLDDTKTPVQDRGKIDKINSTTIFSSSTMYPYSSTRTVKMQPRTIDNVTTDYSHEIKTDYENGSSTMTEIDYDTESSLSESKTINFSNYIKGMKDNETIYFAIRSLANLKLGINTTINLAVPRDFFNNNEFKNYNMRVATDSKVARTHIAHDGLTIDGLKEEDSDESHNGSKEQYIDTINTSLAINNTLSGLSTMLKYSKDTIFLDNSNPDNLRLYQGEQENDDNSINKLLIQFETMRYLDTETIEVLQFDLVDYNIG